MYESSAQDRGKSKKTILRFSRRFQVDHWVAWRKWTKVGAIRVGLRHYRNYVVVHFNDKYKVNPIDNSHSYWWNTFFFPYLSFDKQFCFVTFNVIVNSSVLYFFGQIFFGLPYLPFFCLVTCAKISLDPHNKNKKNQLMSKTTNKKTTSTLNTQFTMLIV